MTLIDSLISYWKLDEASGHRNDSHGINHLTANGGVVSGAGIIGNGADFERSSSQYLSIEDTSQSGLDVSGDFSVSFWTNFEALPTVSATDFNIISKTNTGLDRSYIIRFNNNVSNGLEAEASSDGSTSNAGNGQSIADIITGADVGVLRHWVCTYKLATKQWLFYKDSVALAMTNNSTGTVARVFNSSSPFYIGARLASTVPTGFFDGVIDEVGIWSRVLTPAEVTSLYNSGFGLTYPFGANTGLLSILTS